MHGPQEIVSEPSPLLKWAQVQGARSLLLAILYFLFGHASFLVQVDDVLVTPSPPRKTLLR